MTVLLRVFIVTTLGLVVGCGGSGNTGNTSDFDNQKSVTTLQEPAGTWNVEFAVLLDDCGLLPEGTASFTDFHSISNEAGSYSLLSETLSPAPYLGVMRSNDSLLTDALLEGDIFGDGSYCSLEESMAYNEITDASARALFSLRLLCNDGSCETVLRGEASRVESPLE